MKKLFLSFIAGFALLGAPIRAMQEAKQVPIAQLMHPKTAQHALYAISECCEQLLAADIAILRGQEIKPLPLGKSVLAIYTRAEQDGLLKNLSEKAKIELKELVDAIEGAVKSTPARQSRINEIRAPYARMLALIKDECANIESGANLTPNEEVKESRLPHLKDGVVPEKEESIDAPSDQIAQKPSTAEKPITRYFDPNSKSYIPAAQVRKELTQAGLDGRQIDEIITQLDAQERARLAKVRADNKEIEQALEIDDEQERPMGIAGVVESIKKQPWRWIIGAGITLYTIIAKAKGWFPFNAPSSAPST